LSGEKEDQLDYTSSKEVTSLEILYYCLLSFFDPRKLVESFTAKAMYPSFETRQNLILFLFNLLQDVRACVNAES